MKRTKPTQSQPTLLQPKPLKKPPLTPTTKKKSKQSPISKPSKSQPQDYIIINDNIYSANTFTERNNYEQFLHKVKRQKQVERRSFLVKSQVNQDTALKKSGERGKKERGWKKFSAQDFIQSMSLQQKKEMFFKLQQDIRTANGSSKPSSPHNIFNNNASSTLSFQNELSQRNRLNSERQRLQKFTLLQQKLQNYKIQLMFKWQGQIDKLQQMCRQNKLTEQEKQTKISIIEKLKDHKLKILDCTKTLFEKILREEEYEQEHVEEKTNKIQAILKSLHSFPSLENIDEHYAEKQPSIQHLKVKPLESQTKQYADMSPHKNLNFDSSPLEIVEDNNQHEAFLNQFRDGAWDKSNTKSVEDLKSPLNFLNLQQDKTRFVNWEQHQNNAKKGEEINNNLEYPCNPLFLHSKEELIESEHVLPLSKPLFGDGNDKISLKLDLRLDQVVFGQDEYPQCQKEDLGQFKDDIKVEEEKYELSKEPQNHLNLSLEKASQALKLNLEQLPIKEQEQKPKTFQSSQNQNIIQPTQHSPPKVQKISMTKLSLSANVTKSQSQDDLACKQQPIQKTTINIPMILSRQKMQTLAFQQNRVFRQNLDNRIAFQMGCIELQPPSPSEPTPFHFTTLVDINTYIVGFYEFMMRKYMGSLVDSLNIPYGKSAIDKLYSLQTEGFVIQETYNEMNNILSESHFIEYQRQIMFTMRKCTQHETAHNRAVFQAFTKCINVYRPYFDLQGEVFPWIVSQKGITFYQITEDNIEQVFQKSKIKVLEYCTSLCGLHPPTDIKNEEQSVLMTQKKQQNLTKTIKTEVLEQFEEWKIRFVNFECLVRMLMADKVYKEVLQEVIADIMKIQMEKQLDKSA